MGSWKPALVFVGALMLIPVGIALAGGSGQSDAGPKTEAACTSSEDAFNTWLTGQSAVYGEDLNARYGIQSVNAVCGDVTVDTLIAEDATGHGLAEDACNLLSTAVGAVPSVETVTVRYGTGKNACYMWPGGPSNF